ncbi:hypothetical protein AAY473_039300 [Plecturocebus cupreus]
MEFCHVAHGSLKLLGSSNLPVSASKIETRLGLKLLTSGDPPTSASQSAGITGVSHHAQLQKKFYKANPHI